MNYYEFLTNEIGSDSISKGRAYPPYLLNYNDYYEEEKQFVDLQIAEFMERNCVFPFFVKFRDRMVIPQRISGKHYVEYYASPKKKVFISYAFAKKDGLKFVTEPMRQIYSGIFVKELVLFYNDELDYYIYEEEQGNKVITQSDCVVVEDISDDTGESKQNLLNLLLLAKEVQDDKTLLEVMEEYIKRKHADNLFKPL